MPNPEPKTCKHMPCRCVVPPHQDYCGDICRDAGKDDVEIACPCGHPACPLDA
jgi:hypothetical protein